MCTFSMFSIGSLDDIEYDERREYDYDPLATSTQSKLSINLADNS